MSPSIRLLAPPPGVMDPTALSPHARRGGGDSRKSSSRGRSTQVTTRSRSNSLEKRFRSPSMAKKFSRVMKLYDDET